MPTKIGSIEYLSTAEAAERLGVTASTLRTHRSDGTKNRLETLKLGNVVLYTAASVEAEADRRGAGQ
ncbi:helix-turn-helix domain-containing protein [Streptomyces sp. NPDC057909]|uniref:helix-turn-helix domain-containing protein n=1 Tax=Streptomyces sp. NPDC057909 TaxID=3346277 RepID=UPI0036E15CF1